MSRAMSARTLEVIVMTLALLMPAAAEAGWQERATSFDQGRLARLDEAREKGLSESGGVASDVLNAPVTGGSVAGDWRCRTIKLGGMTPSRVYSWFRCRIIDRGGVLAFEKVTGTQRMAGLLYPEGEGYVYLGASWVKGEPPHRYSGNEASLGAHATPDDQVGVLHATAAGARIEMPFPVQESTFDVIELRR